MCRWHPMRCRNKRNSCGSIPSPTVRPHRTSRCDGRPPARARRRGCVPREHPVLYDTSHIGSCLFGKPGTCRGAAIGPYVLHIGLLVMLDGQVRDKLYCADMQFHPSPELLTAALCSSHSATPAGRSHSQNHEFIPARPDAS